MPLTRARRPRRSPLPIALVAAACLLALWVSPARAQQSEADVFVAQAILAYEDRRYDEALAFLRQALAQDPDNLDALYYTGLTLLAQRKPGEAVEPLERARRRAPDDLALLYQLGVAYFSLRDYDRAEEPLSTVFRAQPTADGVGYYVGFMRYRKRDYRGALEALRAGTSTDPDIQQLSRFYAGLSLAALGERDAAAAEVQEALRMQSTSVLAGPAERLRDTVLAPRRRDQRLNVELRAGVTYDTNVMVLPNPSHDPIAEGAREKRDDQASLGELFSARFEYTFLRSGPWEASIGYQYFAIIYNDLPSFNVQSHLGTVGGSYTSKVAGMPWQAAVSYAYDYTILDDDEFLQRHTVGLIGTLVEGPVNLTALQFRYQHKDFSGDAHIPTSDVRDANNWMAGFLHVFRFAADRHLVRVGYQLDVERAEGLPFNYLGHRAIVGGQYTLPWWGTRLRYDFDVHFRNYQHFSAIFPANSPTKKERSDVEQTHVVRIEQPLPAGFTLAAEYQGIIAKSSLPIFSYNRSVFSLILSWQY
jgi:tetratricopeptide (TPR) repeat protein